MIWSKFDDYHNGDWQQWQSKHLDTAKIFNNSISDALTADQAVKMHKSTVQHLPNFYFDDTSIKVEKTINDKGESGVDSYGT